tara:strand:+ start:384 stop:935 length:552 start_codon:yes stop_codon:yes gene_type:complete
MTHPAQVVILHQLAAPAPVDLEEEAALERELLSGPEVKLEGQPDLNELCEAWAWWAQSRGMYVKPSLPVSLLGRLTSKGTGRSSAGGPDAIASAELMAFHLAFLAQPQDALDRRVFELHYYRRVRNVKAAAATVGVSRQHWYRLVKDCRQRIYVASRQILDRNLSEVSALRSRAAFDRGASAC